eukprot:6016164-Pyramimonas_sp.AAC.1
MINNTIQLNKFVEYDMTCLVLLINVLSAAWTASPSVPIGQGHVVNGLTHRGLRDPNRLPPPGRS